MSPSYTVEDAHRLEFWCCYSHVLYFIAALGHRSERSETLSSQILLGYALVAMECESVQQFFADVKKL